MPHTCISSEIGVFTPLPEVLARNGNSHWPVFLVGIALALCMSVSARADAVSGRVFGPDGKVLPNRTLTAETGKGQVVDFKTDGSGNFSVYLDPGKYTVRPKDDAGLEGIIQSYPQSVQEDIHLKKKAER